MRCSPSTGRTARPRRIHIFPNSLITTAAVSGHLETLLRASQALDIPVIASLNGTTSEGWIEHARSLEQAGAAAIELNIYSIPLDLAVSGAELERRYVEIVREVRSTVRIPIAVKLAPYFTSMPHLAAELVRAGADGLVLFNRYYAPDIDLMTLQVTRSLPLSTRVGAAALARLDRIACRAALRVRSPRAVVSSRMSRSSSTCWWAPMWSRPPRPCCAMDRNMSRRCAPDSNAGSTSNGFDSVDAIRGLKDATHVEHVDALFRAQYVASLTEYLPGKLVQ